MDTEPEMEWWMILSLGILELKQRWFSIFYGKPGTFKQITGNWVFLPQGPSTRTAQTTWEKVLNMLKFVVLPVLHTLPYSC